MFVKHKSSCLDRDKGPFFDVDPGLQVHLLIPDIHQLSITYLAEGQALSKAFSTRLADSVTGVPGPNTPAAPAS